MYNKIRKKAKLPKNAAPSNKESPNIDIPKNIQWQYTVQISVVQESIDGKITYAMPQIIENRNHKVSESKKPHLKIEKDKKQLAFVSEQFYITYNEENVGLHHMALFTLEYDPTYHIKTYIKFKLNTNRYKNEDGGHINLDASIQGLHKVNSARSPPKKKIVIEVDKRILYVNDLMNLDQYQRILFAQCEYFSFLDVYIGSCFLGTRFRLQQHQLSDFYCCDDKVKIDYRMANDNLKLQLTDHDRGDLLHKTTNLSPQQFRSKMNSQLFTAYTNLRQRMQTLIRTYEDENNFAEGREQIKKYIQEQLHIQTILKSKQQLIRLYSAQSNQQLYLLIYKEIVQFDQFLTYIWSLHIRLIQHASYRIFAKLIHKALGREYDVKESSMIINMQINAGLRRLEQSTFLKRRKQVLQSLKIYEDDDIYHPFLMVQNFAPQQIKIQANNQFQISSLVVFIHGYQGSDFDLQKAKNFLTIYSPCSHSLMIKSIQDQIDENIEHLGEKVAQQIRTHITGSVNNYKRISIVGYSLGGVIARESIKHLSDFKDRFNLLITFASPHLGVSVNDNKLVGTGIWYLINFQKVKNLKQLNCEKTGNQAEEAITLEKLSNCDGLSWFNKMIAVSSEEDNFVPYHSSRISCQDLKDSFLQNMAKQITSRLKKIERVEVWFDVDHDIKTFDKILGRRAHIQFLENRIFLDMFFRLYGPQF